MELEPRRPTAKGPAATFTGDVYLTPLHQAEPSRLTAALVRFTPGARTHWHSHPAGQTLHVTEGVGVVVNRDGTVILLHAGDTVYTPPGEEHWHGATAGTFLSHLALTEVAPGEEPATWLEAVTDEAYEAAHDTA